MKRTIRKLLLFTVTACPTGRSMNTVLHEVNSQLNRVEYDLVYIDVQHEIANQYGITQNPTTLFLDERDSEVYRVEGFKDTRDIIDIIHGVELGDLTGTKNLTNTNTTQEKYTVYLFKSEESEPVPVETEYNNKTAVVTPRITAIRLQLAAAEERLSNPFPPKSELLEIDFVNHAAMVKIRIQRPDAVMETGKMELALLYTLRHFGIQSVDLQLIFD
ncbi:thioredoxin family protein [Paenibacillus dakarensis]|uniref:thioredoxin family protein n=1 Tax=Paenibacillus dakarensis TaxID=1527293 RepID=UPI0006D545EF|nr:thioredoxin family protein [Paenibacillus dakarensis]